MRIIYSLFLYSRAALFLLIFGPILLLIPFFSKNAVYPFSKFFSKGIFRCFNIRSKVIGSFPDNLGPFILMHNHTSFLDLFLLPTLIKGKYTGLIAAENFSIPLIGTMLRRLKAIPVYRSSHSKALESIKIAENYLKEGYHIAIFPEGTRTITGKISAFKKGGFHMAYNTKTKILPIIVKGLYEIKPKTRWILKPDIVKITILDPIDIVNKSVDEILEETQNIYLQYD
tara:strand:- start:446 stop:1129 length:684 start_codon:yes stop_codon:yes gene_type:complete